MSSVIPWSLFDEELQVRIRHKSGGRRAYPRILLFKMHLLQSWFGLNDAQTSFQCEDRLSFRKFLGLGITETIPESTTLENFRAGSSLLPVILAARCKTGRRGYP
jgi:IS5 family transposase